MDAESCRSTDCSDPIYGNVRNGKIIYPVCVRHYRRVRERKWITVREDNGTWTGYLGGVLRCVPRAK